MSLADSKLKKAMKPGYQARLKEKISWGKEKRDDSVRNRDSSSWSIPQHLPKTNSHKTSVRVYDPNVHPYRDALARAKMRSNSQLDGKALDIQQADI